MKGKILESKALRWRDRQAKAAGGFQVFEAAGVGERAAWTHDADFSLVLRTKRQ